MPQLTWDDAGSRSFETGVDRGVLYQSDGTGIAWNGLTAVTERPVKVATPVFFDGMKVKDNVAVSSFSGALKAITYPDEFLYYEGTVDLVRGVAIGEQRPKPFNLSWRTKIGSDLDTDANQHKIHVLYNVIAIPNDKVYASISASPTVTEFEWNLTTSQGETTLNGPTAHFIFDERYIDEILWDELQLRLYGGTPANAYPNLPTFEEMIDIVSRFFRVEIVDNKDGTWTAITNIDGYIFMDSDTEIRLEGVNATYSDANTYVLEDTRY